ncbi:MAG: hypothetical protein OIF56_10955, partial [Cohaesibacter sp.]|nr:hypothetical protein [Cohaesibacter sp.]
LGRASLSCLDKSMQKVRIKLGRASLSCLDKSMQKVRIKLGRASLSCLDKSMQKVRIKKENTPALSIERYLLSKPFQSILWLLFMIRHSAPDHKQKP